MLVVTDDTSARHASEEQRLIDATTGRKRILVRNKSDLMSGEAELRLESDHLPQVSTSSISGAGIDELRRRIVAEVGGDSAQQESGFVTNLRQRKLIEESLGALSDAEKAVHDHIPHEMLLMDLYRSLRPLDSVTGETTTDDILNLIFSTFCIGK